MSNSPKLSLPYLQASQAQKHVTHNEALQALDVIVQASAINRDLTTPPASPAEGDVYIVAAAGAGAWVGHDNELAAWQGGAWSFHAPNEGWRVWLNDEDILLAWGGAAWLNASGTNTELNPATGGLVGINATADVTNRLSVSSPATLLNNEGAGHQLKINKNAAIDTASLLFQTGWTGQAEMGLSGSNDFSIKTSDGTNWFDALECSSANGRVKLPSGVSGRIEIFDTGNGIFIGEGAGANDDLTNNNNTFVGYYAGHFSTTGSSNTANGVNALRSNTTGNSNTAIGVNAGRFITAGGGNQTSSNGVYLGPDTRASQNGNSNEIVIGASTRGNGSNTVTLGSTAITGAHVQVAWTIVSDERDKTDIAPVDHGLDFINQINPVKFRYTETRGGPATGPSRYGFSAQDVLNAEGANPVIVDATDLENLKLNETALISVLVKAVKELAAKVKELENA